MDNNIMIKQQVPFTQVPNELLYNPNISFKAKGLWAYMNAKPDGWNFSADRIALETKEERKSILAGLKELAEHGYITAKKRSDGRIEYTLHWESTVSQHKEQVEPTPEPEEPEKNDEPEAQVSEPSYNCDKSERVVGPPKDGRRPMRKYFDSDEEFEKAFYKWNSVAYN